MRRPGDRLSTSVTWVVIVAWTAWWAWRRHDPSGISWHWALQGAHALVGADGLQVYARHPELQIGPLTFVAVAPLTLLPRAAGLAAAQVAMVAAGPVALASLPVRGPRRRLRLLAAGVLLAPSWTELAVRWAHPDDVLAITLGVLAVRAVASRRAVAAGLLLGAAVAAKPWALGFWPVLVGLGPAAAQSVGAATAAAVTALTWGPFLVVLGTLGALRPPVGLADTSVLRLAGVRGDVVPPWVRTAQLLGAPAVAGLAALRGRWPGVLLVAVAVRIALDPQANAYYTGSAVPAALVADLLLAGSVVPRFGVATALALWQPFVGDYARRFELARGPALLWFRHPSAVAGVHLAWAVAVVVGVLAVRTRAVRA